MLLLLAPSPWWNDVPIAIKEPLWRFVAPHPLFEGQARRQFEFMNQILLLVVPVCVLSTVFRGLLDGSVLSPVGIVGLVSGALLMGCLLLGRTKHAPLTAWLVIFVAMGAIFGSSLAARDPNILIYVSLPVVFAGVLLSARGAMRVSLLTAVFAGAVSLSPVFDDLNLCVVVITEVVLVSILVLAGARLRDRAEAERRRQLTESEERYRRAVETAYPGFALIERGAIVETNSMFADLLHRSMDALRGSNPSDLFPPDSSTSMETLITDGGVAKFRTRGKDATASYVEVIATVLPHTGRGDTRFLAVRDITQRRQMEMHLAASERAASLGELAAGVAHEINNPLSSAGGDGDS